MMNFFTVLFMQPSRVGPNPPDGVQTGSRVVLQRRGAMQDIINSCKSETGRSIFCEGCLEQLEHCNQMPVFPVGEETRLRVFDW